MMKKSAVLLLLLLSFAACGPPEDTPDTPRPTGDAGTSPSPGPVADAGTQGTPGNPNVYNQYTYRQTGEATAWPNTNGSPLRVFIPGLRRTLYAREGDLMDWVLTLSVEPATTSSEVAVCDVWLSLDGQDILTQRVLADTSNSYTFATRSVVSGSGVAGDNSRTVAAGLFYVSGRVGCRVPNVFSGLVITTHR